MLQYSYVYVMASINRVLCIGVTSDLGKRVAEHRCNRYPNSFTSQYRVHRLVYWEEYVDISEAIAREKQLKSWRRGKKLRLIESRNHDWDDLAPPAQPGPSLRSG
jgi:putative endonuclease